MKRLALILTLLSAPAVAQDAGLAARDAAEALEAASILLDTAEDSRDRVAALTDTVRAFEDGLAAMRDGLRDAAIRETELTRKLAAQDAEVAQLLGALSALGSRAEPQTLLHPQGPLGTARSGMLVAAVTPGLAAKAAALRSDLEEVTALRELQQSAAKTLEDGLAGVQRARTDLSQAIADRTDLPKRFTEDPIRTQILISATETLNGFASGLSQITENEVAEVMPPIEDRKGILQLPVRGVIIRQAGQADAAGVTRPGIVMATRPSALVTTPTAATIRYNGPLLDYGLVSILEPQGDLLFVLAGLDAVFGEIGDVLPAGSPVGLMGGDGGDIVSLTSEGGGAGRSETLYIEVREGGTPVDPLTWFTTE
ncbi:murein hydrolase activator EnvC family protein [Tropicibacter naphthalenivorans]|uniref:Membrane-bound metallopeptidase n=1 Tax=Tropicibacter naphthalenivorans TaxID=441103 RepID=A0A0P1FZB3_9RHOB|nr:peptidoglycan DD-metalloendopeptidase family protein [Tropicibacter naphthalenivorans]CUH74717.1 Membrane-bound metallopeptidase [Tropicibacter naphthalenivorans]SMC49599.1 Septal ring factor EnvC, activator of murein hydrolases AmiA and AmiB [Tropicibacter naphthalenivorans]